MIRLNFDDGLGHRFQLRVEGLFDPGPDLKITQRCLNCGSDIGTPGIYRLADEEGDALSILMALASRDGAAHGSTLLRHLEEAHP